MDQLEAPDDRELWDIGLSRNDIPRAHSNGSSGTNNRIWAQVICLDGDRQSGLTTTDIMACGTLGLMLIAFAFL